MAQPYSRSDAVLDKRMYRVEQVIFTEGDEGDVAYLIESGTVGIYHCDPRTNLSTRLGGVGAGEIFGEMALIDGAPRMATAIADSAAVVIRIPKSVVEQKVKGSDAFVRGMLNIFIKHIRENHKSFVRKPRSMADSLKMIDAYAAGIVTFMQKAEPTPHTAEMQAMAEQVRALTGKMVTLSGHIEDRRNSVIASLDVEGVSFRDVLKTE